MTQHGVRRFDRCPFPLSPSASPLLLFLVGSRYQKAEYESQDLQGTLDDVSRNLFTKGHWSLGNYRQWENASEHSSYIALTGTGELIDLKAAPDLIRITLPPHQYMPRFPSELRTDTGETWLMESRHVPGGDIVGGIVNVDETGLREPAHLLSGEVAKFGSTLQSAANLDTTVIRNFMSETYVVDDSGKIVNQNGSIPLKVELTLPSTLLDGFEHRLTVDGEIHEFQSRWITSDSPHLIVAFDDLALDDLHQTQVS